jgi:hypothetical protein
LQAGKLCPAWGDAPLTSLPARRWCEREASTRGLGDGSAAAATQAAGKLCPLPIRFVVIASRPPLHKTCPRHARDMPKPCPSRALAMPAASAPEGECRGDTKTTLSAALSTHRIGRLCPLPRAARRTGAAPPAPSRGRPGATPYQYRMYKLECELQACTSLTARVLLATQRRRRGGWAPLAGQSGWIPGGEGPTAGASPGGICPALSLLPPVRNCSFCARLYSALRL